MSLVFNDTTNKSGIIQAIEKECGYNDGDISGNSLRLKQFTASVNQSLDAALSIIFAAGGKWQFDDTNHTKYNIIYTNIVSGQRDYSFVNDEQGNLILTIDSVYRSISNGGQLERIDPIDPVSESDSDYRTDNITNNLSIQGIPQAYDKLGNGFMFDVIPNYNATRGIMLYISREASYFTSTDTTKKPGFLGLYHRFCVVWPALEYARIHLPQNRVNSLQGELNQITKDLKDAYGQRAKDEKPVIRNRITPYR